MSKLIKSAMSILLIGVLLVFASGCATIFKGEYRKVKIDSEPGGAQIYVNGEYFGQTPLRIDLRPDQEYTIEFRKADYQIEVRRIKNRIGAGWIVLDVVCGGIPVLIDALTGAWYDLDQKYVNALLERQQEKSLN